MCDILSQVREKITIRPNERGDKIMQLRAPNALKANSSYGALRSFSAFLPGDESARSRKQNLSQSARICTQY